MRRISADRYRAPAQLAGRVFLLLGLGYVLIQLTMDITAAVANHMLSYGPTARLAIFAGAAFWGGCAYALYIECGRMLRRLFGPTADEDEEAPATVTVLPAGNKTGERA